MARLGHLCSQAMPRTESEHKEPTRRQLTNSSKQMTMIRRSNREIDGGSTTRCLVSWRRGGNVCPFRKMVSALLRPTVCATKSSQVMIFFMVPKTRISDSGLPRRALLNSVRGNSVLASFVAMLRSEELPPHFTRRKFLLIFENLRMHSPCFPPK